jgi:hypothetical protein
VADGPTAADVNARAGARSGDDATAALPLACLAAGVPADGSVLALRASSVRVWDAGRIAADARRVADVRCFHQVWEPVLLRVLRPARACLAEDLVSDLVHATREAALRRDSRGGIRATAGKTVFPSPFFFPLRYWENVESVSRLRRKGKTFDPAGLNPTGSQQLGKRFRI